MSLRTFKYRPTQSSYSVEDAAEESLRIQLDGGAGRFRRDILGASKIVNCRWMLSKSGYDYARAFYRAWNAQPGPFLIDLILEEGALTACKAWFVPKTFVLDEQRGNAYIVTAQLEVEPPLRDPQADIDMLDLMDAFGPEWQDWLADIDYLVNVKLPKDLPA